MLSVHSTLDLLEAQQHNLGNRALWLRLTLSFLKTSVRLLLCLSPKEKACLFKCFTSSKPSAAGLQRLVRESVVAEAGGEEAGRSQIENISERAKRRSAKTKPPSLLSPCPKLAC